jgi:hypothetical protein
MFTWASLLLLVVAGTRLRRRELAAVGLLVVAQYVLPILLQAMQYNTNGPVWQGRYTLPLTVAVPIFTLMLSAPRWEGSRLLRSATWLFPAALAVLTWVHFAALTVELRRNVSGLDGPSFLHGVWQPPLGSLTLVVTQAGLLCVVVGAVVVLTAQERRPAVRRSTGGAAAEEEARHGRRAGLGIGASGSLG